MAATPKTCWKCGESKPLEDFHRSAERRDGRQSQCKACKKAYQVGWWKSKTPEEKRAWDERNQRWAEQNPEASKARFRRWQHKNRDRAAKREVENALWRAGSSSRCDAVKRGATEAELVLPLVLLEEQDGVCGICGEDVDPFDFHMDHIVPVQQGGPHVKENLQLAHPVCNMAKGSKVAA